jgi:hypothetical protein
MKIQVKTIQHKEQRYETVGDWWWDKKNTLQIRVSEMSNPKYEQLVALHEIVEALLCDDAGVAEEDVTAFDIAFEKIRPPGDESEAGDSKSAPYYHQHQVATMLEQMFAIQLNVRWSDYEKEVNSL